MLENFEMRNADFLAAYRQVVREARRRGVQLSRREALQETLAQRAPRFYLQREHVWKMLARRRKRKPATERSHRTRMWQEIEEALTARCAGHPRETPWEALDYVLERHSPSSFFITESYAKRLLLEAEAKERRNEKNNKH